MDARVSMIIKCLDRLTHHSTSEMDVLQTVDGIRRRLGNDTLGDLLDGGSQDEVRSLRRVIDSLHEELASLETENEELLNLQSDLEHQLEHSLRPSPNDNDDILNTELRDSYSDLDVLRIKQQKFGKVHGIGTLWANFSACLKADDPTVQLVTLPLTQQWRIKGVYPGWAVEQLLAMPDVFERQRHKWSAQDIEFLRSLHNDAPGTPYNELAAICSKKFGVAIGVNSIRGKLHGLRKQNRIAPARALR